MNESVKLVFFDFCETLVKYQTADGYVDFCRRRLRYKRMLFLHIIITVLSKLFFFRIMGRINPNNALRKKIVLSQLKKVDYATLDKLAEEYYKYSLKPSFISPLIERLVLHLQSNDKVWIVSGGYDIYIKYFVEEYRLAGYISTNIAFTDKLLCLGTFRGLDCMRENKVFLIKEKFGDLLDKTETIAYSDNSSDLPLLLMAMKGYVVSKNKTQDWVMKNNLKEIIWE